MSAPSSFFFLGPPGVRKLIAFPQVKELVISHPVKFTEDKGMSIVELFFFLCSSLLCGTVRVQVAHNANRGACQAAALTGSTF